MRCEPLLRGLAFERYAFRLVWAEPSMVVLAVVEASVMILIIFAVHLEFEADTMVALRIFGKVEIAEVQLFTSLLLPKWIQAFSYLAALSGIALSASIWSEMLNNPLLEQMLAIGINRWEAIVWKLIGTVAAFVANLTIFSLCAGAILTAKGWQGDVLPLLAAALSEAWWLTMICSWGLVMTMITDHPMSVLCLLTLVFFLLGPLVGSASQVGRPLLICLAMIVPPTGTMIDWTTLKAMGRELPEISLAATVATPVANTLLGILLFQRKDL